jgi:hypothetical protein
MQLEYILNEISLRPVPSSIDEAKIMMDAFIGVVIQSRAIGVKANIRAHANISEIEIYPNYFISNWCKDESVPKEKRHYVLKLLTSHPILSELPDQVIEDIKETEVSFESEPGVGLAVGFLTDNPILSFNTAVKWQPSSLEVQVSQLKKNHQSQVEIVSTNATLLNISSLDSLSENKEEIFILASSRFLDIADFWSRKGDVFPFLRFSPDILDRIQYLTPRSQFFQQAMMRLLEINKYCESWDGKEFSIAECIPNVTPESKSTMQAHGDKRLFKDDTGQLLICEWHARFTPGPGRIHFCRMKDTNTLFIGYLGLKLQE